MRHIYKSGEAKQSKIQAKVEMHKEVINGNKYADMH